MNRIAAFLVVLVALAAIASGLVHFGAERERREVALEDAKHATKTAAAQAQTHEAVAIETDAFAHRRETLNREADDGAREIETQLGAGTLVDPHLARLVLCRVERVRGEPATHCAAGDDRADGEPPAEPVLARPPA